MLASKRYKCKDENVLNTSWSELKKCSTTHGALTLAKAIVFGEREWAGDDFGSLRHSMFEMESKSTGRMPECFKHIGLDFATSLHEEQFEMELMPGVVLHSTIDCYAHEMFMIVDYKTFTNEEDLQKYNQPAKKAQLIAYSLQLVTHGYRVTGALFAGERWNKERTKLLGYDHIIIPISMLDIVKQRDVMKQNAIRLLSAISVLENEKKVLQNL